jgi:hypothetical protein
MVPSRFPEVPLPAPSAFEQMLLDAESALRGSEDDVAWALAIPVPLIREDVASDPAVRALLFGPERAAEVGARYLAVMEAAAAAEVVA